MTKDWNKVFREQLAAQRAAQHERLLIAKADAANTEKEAFDIETFKVLYRRHCVESFEPEPNWDVVVPESEYDYYVVRTEVLTLLDYVRQCSLDDGWS